MHGTEDLNTCMPSALPYLERLALLVRLVKDVDRPSAKARSARPASHTPPIRRQDGYRVPELDKFRHSRRVVLARGVGPATRRATDLVDLLKVGIAELKVVKVGLSGQRVAVKEDRMNRE
jgi:hypothetical protein